MNINLAKIKQLSESSGNLINTNHIAYLSYLKRSGVEPKVIYDIGACFGNWTKEARKLWPTAEIVLFEASPHMTFLYGGEKHFISVLSDSDNKEVTFYENPDFPTGSSYYQEIGLEISKVIYDSNHSSTRKTIRLDTIVNDNKLPLPDLVKIDTQGSELDILRGGIEALKQCQHLILELQHTDYNKDAPKAGESLVILKQMGWQCVAGLFANNGADGDYHFMKDSIKTELISKYTRYGGFMR
jgi:FkbM family methyltransferase